MNDINSFRNGDIIKFHDKDQIREVKVLSVYTQENNNGSVDSMFYAVNSDYTEYYTVNLEDVIFSVDVDTLASL